MFAAASPSSSVCLVSRSTAVSVEHKRTHSIVSCVCKRTYSIVSCVCKRTYSIVSVSVAVSVRVLLLWNVFSYYRMFSLTVECVCLHFCVCVCDTTCILSTLPTLSLPSLYFLSLSLCLSLCLSASLSCPLSLSLSRACARALFLALSLSCPLALLPSRSLALSLSLCLTLFRAVPFLCPTRTQPKISTCNGVGCELQSPSLTGPPPGIGGARRGARWREEQEEGEFEEEGRRRSVEEADLFVFNSMMLEQGRARVGAELGSLRWCLLTACTNRPT